jgi:hypothetical protein
LGAPFRGWHVSPNAGDAHSRLLHACGRVRLNSYYETDSLDLMEGARTYPTWAHQIDALLSTDCQFHDALLGAVVEISLDAPPFAVAGLDDAGTRGLPSERRARSSA